MKIQKIEKDTETVSVKKAEKALTDLIQVFSKHKLSVEEILLVYGNLGYTLGASIGGYKKGPDANTLAKLYAEKPSVDIALMINGLQITFWIDDLKKIKKPEVNND